ncbi:Alpha/beta hydrolase fold-1 [Massariosphaeria phaeospora]|uniref:Alpha/beta hydrolase fold-1 n=1 Tax=Massariosphaeria phaeospora TaxID=100035 RepID=A0A7C8I495_9PLEO|nr:Alpha/beta hydrolase fold-1 [Massariosphaeria phaeospora]
MANPTVVLVPGAWHSPIHYAPLTQLLEAANHTVVTARLPSVGSSTPKDQSVANDASFIENKLLRPLMEQGKDVLLLMHSYGGCPGAVAAKGHSKKERMDAGQKGGIVGLVFLCAFLAGEGDSLKSKLPNQEHFPWVMENSQTSQLSVSDPGTVFYNDVPSAAAATAISHLALHAEPALSSPSGPPAWLDAAYDGKRAYLQTQSDNTIPFVAQDAMVKYSGVQWDVEVWETGHSPFLVRPEALAEWVVGRVRAYGV